MFNRLSFRPITTALRAQRYCLSSEVAEQTPLFVKKGKGRGRPSKKMMGNRPIVQNQRQRNNELNEKATSNNLEWRTVCSTILHRYPVITPDKQPWEKEFEDMQDKIETRRRMIMIEQLEGTDGMIISSDDPTYEEIIESMPFKPAPRITEADEKNDRHSMERRLQESLFLIVKRNRGDFSWQFPQGRLTGEESLRAGAERVFERAVGKTRRWFVGNAPVGHYQYEYPAAVQQKRKNFGAQLFFYRAQYLAGNLKLNTKLYKDYAWIARDEVHEYFDKDTADYLSHLLPY